MALGIVTANVRLLSPALYVGTASSRLCGCVPQYTREGKDHVQAVMGVLQLLDRQEKALVQKSVSTVSLRSENSGTLAEMTVSAEVDRVWRVLTSFEEMPAHLSSMTRCKVLKKNGKYWLVEQIARIAIPLMPLSFRVILDVVEDRPFLHFKQLYGSFTRFRGYWQVENCSPGTGSVVRYYLEASLIKGLRGRPFERHFHRIMKQNMKDLAVWIDN